MAAPVITWLEVTGTATSATYATITSLDFGTVTVNVWSIPQCIVPKVATNSIQSAEWWLYDVSGTRSAASVTMGTAGGWNHRMTVSDTYIKPSGLSASATWGTESPESTASGYAYSAVAAAAYGDFVFLALQVDSGAGDGAHTAWGYQLKYSYT